MQKYLLPAFFNAQQYCLIHQVKEIEKCRLIHTRSMSMVERHLKSLKTLVRQKTCHKNSITKRYMVYQLVIYITQKLPKMTANISMHYN